MRLCRAGNSRMRHVSSDAGTITKPEVNEIILINRCYGG